MFDLSGKAALVTGASGGIGAAIARALHGAGAKVGLSGRKVEALESLAAELGGERVAVLPGELGDAAEVEALAEKAESALGQVDILVNNAGLTRDMLFMRLSDEMWDEVIAVNLTGAFRLTRAVSRGMMRRRYGRIISVTSVVGTMGNAGQANYAASKAGLVGMTKSLAQEIATRNVTVNCVAPGFIATAMTDVLNDKIKEATLAKIPANRFGKPEDVAAAVAFLASGEAGYITGQTLHVNGGMAMI
ncbi:3-oxoacyl-[acyl-carrier-protein] reductase [Zavarzinia aquatilis]|uniref:3-oxoacyl-[acyl-carrier-protein] reductase n=1 Tax=Zavarzinia aquatilis TaxID=2211142 RepID=A0A317E8D2_9PROT|nr:3-oxoacyl-[acyl-carrier-protein] reductase [Zavarzinia aquatilis]PWR22961.1 3-oxoacyl-[acyl-carrier-protein] reductase [Zavarzinia aquatilis]